MNKAKLIFRPRISETLQAMEVGDVVVVDTKNVKINTARNAANRLKGKGYVFVISDKDMINQFRVERIS